MTNYTTFQMLKVGLSFYRKAQTIYDIQSPYLYSIIKAMQDKEYQNKPILEEVENLRASLKKNPQKVEGIDYGAGSRKKVTNKTIGMVANTSASCQKAGILLHNLVKFSKPETILELGTNLGLGTAYLASAIENATVHTIEGHSEIGAIARQNADFLGLKNIQFYQGTFFETIPELNVNDIDFVFLDGHHDGNATIKYVEMLIPLMKDPSLIIIDDINWSNSMNIAFQHLIQQPYVSSYIDLFDKGILILNSDLEKTPGVKYLPYWYKPWRIGLWGGKGL